MAHLMLSASKSQSCGESHSAYTCQKKEKVSIPLPLKTPYRAALYTQPHACRPTLFRIDLTHSVCKWKKKSLVLSLTSKWRLTPLGRGGAFATSILSHGGKSTSDGKGYDLCKAPVLERGREPFPKPLDASCFYYK